jgi:hypothetical protein
MAVVSNISNDDTVHTVTYLERLEEVFTRGIFLSIILNGVGRKVSEPIIRVVGMIEKNFIWLFI